MVPLQFGFPGGVELLIIGLLFLVVPVVLAAGLTYWVYTDAQRRGNEHAALWAAGVGGFTLLTFLGGLLVLAVYLWDRDRDREPAA